MQVWLTDDYRQPWHVSAIEQAGLQQDSYLLFLKRLA